MVQDHQFFRINHDSMDEFRRIWSLILEVVCDGNSCKAEIDAYPDEEWTSFSQLPSQVQAAQRTLKAWASGLQPGRHFKNVRMAINPDMRNDLLRDAVRVFGPFSISARVADENEEIVLENQDGGSGLVRVSEIGRSQLADALAERGLEFESVLTPLEMQAPRFRRPWRL